MCTWGTVNIMHHKVAAVYREWQYLLYPLLCVIYREFQGEYSRMDFLLHYIRFQATVVHELYDSLQLSKKIGRQNQKFAVY